MIALLNCELRETEQLKTQLRLRVGAIKIEEKQREIRNLQQKKRRREAARKRK